MEERSNVSSAGANSQTKSPETERIDYLSPQSRVLSEMIERALETAAKPQKKRKADVAKAYLKEMSWPRRIIALLWMTIIYGSNIMILRYSITTYLPTFKSSPRAHL